MPKTTPKPILLDERCLTKMTWDRSIREQAARVEKDKQFGHEVEAKCGDEVRTHDGRTGILVQKEFLYRNTPCGPGHDVWLLGVQFKAEIVTYSNPSAIVKTRDRSVAHAPEGLKA